MDTGVGTSYATGRFVNKRGHGSVPVARSAVFCGDHLGPVLRYFASAWHSPHHDRLEGGAEVDEECRDAMGMPSITSP